jgi:DNA-binding HxlR family transcriptional regulator
MTGSVGEPRKAVVASGARALLEPEGSPPELAGFSTPRRSTRPGPSPALPSPELEQLFLRFRESCKEFRKEVLVAAGSSLALPPSDQAQANLEVVRSIFGKWSIDLLTVLVTMRSARFSDLRRMLRGISSDVLSQKLQTLESAGLLERRVDDGRPPAVEYRLTEDGRTITHLGEPILLFLRLRLQAAALRGDARPASRRQP